MRRRNRRGRSGTSQNSSRSQNQPYLVLECSGFLEALDALFAILQALRRLVTRVYLGEADVPIPSEEGLAGSH